ncbi:hypothetical protein BJ322DRAFT_1103001 [Thelephora terrestris]|uniref:Uncharacterized protein n=1 Tax=Thelephora terrestris TaxID=56493 RepID=A0A9P6HQN6_9AGAM|nr:hypothetical protein BJ322DRAFT_1103001 [Thelephora terrestris]
MAQETLSDGVIYDEVTLVTYGMFLWDYSITLWFEINFIEGKLKLRWPLIPYFLARYSTLGFVIACLLFQSSKVPLNCDALYLGGVLLGKVAVVAASVNVLVRTVIIWSYRWYIVLSLGLLVSGEVILICVGMCSYMLALSPTPILIRGGGFGKRYSSAAWSNDLQSCIVIPGSQADSLGIFAPYALGVECVIVTLTIIGLRKFDPKSGFANLLIRQGLGFFFLVLLFQIFVTVGVYNDGSGVLLGITSVLCAVIIPMVSCHMVRSILSSSYRFVQTPID